MKKTDKKQNGNEELSVLGTHAAGATDLFQTSKTQKNSEVQPPEHPGGAGTG
ncbi:hypothetical protein [Brevibacillus borstelensis]|uniref:hypothetical protein n=1 Tax=Brevibacillus borstelensis TaxID=45462 RepID=UPI0030BA993F